MDILSIGGIVLAIVAILGGQMLEGGHPSSILQATAFIIVMGGTVGAVMVNYPMAIFYEGHQQRENGLFSRPHRLEGDHREDR